MYLHQGDLILVRSLNIFKNSYEENENHVNFPLWATVGSFNLIAWPFLKITLK